MKVDTFCKFVLSALLCYFCENPMIPSTALVLKDVFAPQSPSIQAVLDSGFFQKFKRKFRLNLHVLAFICDLLSYSLLRSADNVGRPFCCCIVFSFFLFFSFPLTAFCDFSAIFHRISLIFGQLVDYNL